MTDQQATEDQLDIDWGNDRLNRAQVTITSQIYDIESWTMLVREAQSRHVEEVRPLYEKMVQVYPTTARYWKIYIEQEMKGRNFERVEKVLKARGKFYLCAPCKIQQSKSHLYCEIKQ